MDAKELTDQIILTYDGQFFSIPNLWGTGIII